MEDREALPRWWVWKFGGSSLRDSTRIRACARLVADQINVWDSSSQNEKPSTFTGGLPWSNDHLCVTVSAMGGVTSRLQDILDTVMSDVPDPSIVSPVWSPSTGLGSYTSVGRHKVGGHVVRKLNDLYDLHVSTVKELVGSSEDVSNFVTQLATDLAHIMHCLETVRITRDPTTCNYLLGFGEVWSHSLFSEALRACLFSKVGTQQGDHEEDDDCEHSMHQTPTLGSTIPTPSTCGDEAASSPHRSVINVITPIDSRDVIVSMNWNELSELQSVAVDQLHRISHAGGVTTPAVDPLKLTGSFLPCMSRTDLHRMLSVELNNQNGDQSSSSTDLATGHHPSATHPTNNTQSTYTLESAPMSTNPTPIDNLTPANGTLFDKWPLPRPNTFSKGFWPVLNPSVNHNAFPGINFKMSYTNLYHTFHKQATRRILDAWKSAEATGCVAAKGSTGSNTIGNNLTSSAPSGNDNSQLRIVMVCPGFVCRRMTKRVPGNLGRNGSDTSAVAYAVLLRAEGCTIWSDVDGIYSADPRICPDAILLKTLSYAEALELASFGAKVLHPACLIPAMHFRIPLLLKNTFKPQNEGTLITDATFKPSTPDHGAFGKTVTRLAGVTLLTIHNQSFVPHFLTRLFTAAESASDGGEHLLFISQTSTSSAITLGIPAGEEDGIVGELVRAFKYDVTRGAKIEVNIERGCSLLCVTGQDQMGYVGALASWCESLAERNVSIKAVSQSSNEISTCFAVKAEEEHHALKGLHAKILSKLV